MNKLKKPNGRTKRLEELESKIADCVFSFGRTLGEIQSHELYLETHETWDGYCKERWGITRQYGLVLIKTAKTFDNVETIVSPVTAKTLKVSQLKEVSKVPDKKQAAVVAAVIEKCEQEKREPTAKDYKEAAKPFIPPKPEPENIREPGDESEEDGEDPIETPSTPEPSASIVLDQCDKPIPKKLVESYDMRAILVTLGNQVNPIVRSVSDHSDSAGGEWLEVQRITELLKEAKALIWDSAYHTCCPACSGKGCSRCQNTGYLPKYKMGHLSAAEMEACK